MANADTQGTPGPAKVPAQNIKRGASLYSFQEEYFLRKMGLEDIIATCEKLDIPGIEIIGEQMAPGFPEPGEAFFQNWHEWMRKYGRTPVCHDLFLDWNKYEGRMMTDEEARHDLVRDIEFAHKLGCKVIRVGSGIAPKWIELALPYAEERDIKLAVEIHSPRRLNGEWIELHLEVIQRTGTRHYGFLPDMGIFTRRFPRVVSERWVRDGLRQEIADRFVELYNSGLYMDDLQEASTKIGATEQEAFQLGYGMRLGIFEKPRDLLKIKDYIFHIHAKFYEMLPDYTEYSIAYDEVVPVLIEAGFDGHLSSEYEGNRHIQDAFPVDSTEQVRRQHAMFKQLIGEVPATETAAR